MKRALTVLAVVAMVASLASPGWSQMRRGGGQGAFAQATPEQRQQFLDDTVQLRESLWQKQSQLNALLSNKDSDPAQIGTLQKDILQVREQIVEKARDAGIECPYGGPGAGCGRRGMGYGKGGGMGMGRGMGPGGCMVPTTSSN